MKNSYKGNGKRYSVKDLRRRLRQARSTDATKKPVVHRNKDSKSIKTKYATMTFTWAPNEYKTALSVITEFYEAFNGKLNIINLTKWVRKKAK